MHVIYKHYVTAYAVRAGKRLVKPVSNSTKMTN